MRVAVTIPYFDFFPELKSELARRYPGAKFRTDRHRLSEDQFIEFARGHDAAVIGIEHFSDRVFAALPAFGVHDKGSETGQRWRSAFQERTGFLCPARTPRSSSYERADEDIAICRESDT